MQNNDILQRTNPSLLLPFFPPRTDSLEVEFENQRRASRLGDTKGLGYAGCFANEILYASAHVLSTQHQPPSLAYKGVQNSDLESCVGTCGGRGAAVETTNPTKHWTRTLFEAATPWADPLLDGEAWANHPDSAAPDAPWREEKDGTSQKVAAVLCRSPRAYWQAAHRWSHSSEDPVPPCLAGVLPVGAWRALARDVEQSDEWLGTREKEEPFKLEAVE